MSFKISGRHWRENFARCSRHMMHTKHRQLCKAHRSEPLVAPARSSEVQLNALVKSRDARQMWGAHLRHMLMLETDRDSRRMVVSLVCTSGESKISQWMPFRFIISWCWTAVSGVCRFFRGRNVRVFIEYANLYNWPIQIVQPEWDYDTCFFDWQLMWRCCHFAKRDLARANSDNINQSHFVLYTRSKI